MTIFTSIDQFKAAAKFFPKGRIIPQRILKATRKFKHRITFGSDAWAIPTPAGYLIALDTKRGGSAIYVKGPRRGLIYGAKSPTITGQASPYIKGGVSKFVGNDFGEEQQLKSLNDSIAAAAA